MKNEALLDEVFTKAGLKRTVSLHTKQAFELFRSITKNVCVEFTEYAVERGCKECFEFTNRGDFEFEMSIAGDILIFVHHTNVFEFPRTHELMKTPYIKEDPTRSYCGMINIYNFLKDSFDYNRENDIGYLIGRVFVNKENHYFIEGKREIGLLFGNFNTSKVNSDSMRDIVESAILYTSKFDLLTPPYDEVKLVSVSEMKATFDFKQIATGKRLGFRFQADSEEVKKSR